MKDVEYAGFAQLSYLEWHDLTDGKIGKGINEIIKTDFKSTLINGDYQRGIDAKTMQTDGYDYYVKKMKVDENGIATELTPEEAKTQDGIKIYAATDCRMFLLYSEDEKDAERNPKFKKDFDDWKFLCAYDSKKIKEELKEKKVILGSESCDFQASAFYNDATKEVMIAYRGSDDMGEKNEKGEKIHYNGDWVNTNTGLAIFHQYVDALVCAAWFYDKVRDCADVVLGKGKYKIGITGHSMGGALAEFAHVYSGGKHYTKTWNGLGIGAKEKNIIIHSLRYPYFIIGDFKIFVDIFNLKFAKFDFKYDNKWEGRSSEAVIQEYIESPDIKSHNFSKEEIENFRVELGYKLNMIYHFQSNFDKISNSKENKRLDYVGRIKNFYLIEDLTPNLHKRIGEIVVVNDPNMRREGEIDTEGTDFWRVLGKFFTKNFGAYHSVVNFLPFIGDDGMIQRGKITKKYELNAIKTIAYFAKDSKEKTEKYIKANQKPEFYTEYMDWFNLYKIGEEDKKKVREYFNKEDHWSGSGLGNERIRDLDKLNNNLARRLLFLKNIDKSIKEKYNKNWYTVDYAYGILGEFTNCHDIAGVQGGFPVKIEHSRNIDALQSLEEFAKENKKLIDTVTVRFLREYHKNYQMKYGKDDIVYNKAKSILEKVNLTAFNLMDELVIKMKENVKNTKEQKAHSEGVQLLQNVRTSFEKSMEKDLEKDKYLAENQGVEECKDADRIKELNLAFNDRFSRTPKSLCFFKSFTKEEKLEKGETKKDEKPITITKETETTGKETNYEVLARIGNGQYAAHQEGKTITLREAHEKGYINLDDYRRKKA